jgi:uncharacterized protein YidB (DUF937 family)
MDILQYGAQLLRDQFGGTLDMESIGGALQGLLGNGAGEIDLMGLAGKLSSSGELGNILATWLGDGANAPISSDSLKDILGGDRIAEFAGQLGVDTDTAANGLAQVIPQMLDKASSGGSLLEAAGGLGGLMGSARSFFS